MSDHLPPLADLLPHLHAGDHITAEFNDGCTISGPLTGAGKSGLMWGGRWVRLSSSRPSFSLTAITSAPDAHRRYLAAQQPTWADGTSADDETVAVVAAENDYGQQRRYGRGADGWIALDGWEEGPDHIATARLIKRGARPVARYITAQPAPERQHSDDCDCGPGGFGCCMPSDCWCHQPAPEPATCDRDHEPPTGSIVRDKDGDRWVNDGGIWHRTDHKQWDGFPWDALLAIIGPLTLAKDVTNTGAEQ